MSTNQAVITAQRVTVMLNTQNDWEEWLKIVKSKTYKNEIWDFVNPSTPKAGLPTLEMPTESKISDVNSEKTCILKLKDLKKNTHQMLIHQYEWKVKIYNQKKTALWNLWFFIQGSIFHVYLNQIFKSETAHDMLIDLKNRVISTDQIRKHNLAACYHHLKKTLKIQHVKTWF